MHANNIYFTELYKKIYRQHKFEREIEMRKRERERDSGLYDNS